MIFGAENLQIIFTTDYIRIRVPKPISNCHFFSGIKELRACIFFFRQVCTYLSTVRKVKEALSQSQTIDIKII